MKLFFLFFFLSVFSCFSQTKTMLGVKAGLSMYTAYMQHSFYPIIMNINWKPGFTGGVQLVHFSNKYERKINFGLQTGVNYHQKGWSQPFDTSIPTHQTRINYLEFPIDGMAYFGKKNKYYIFLGIFLEYALDSEVDKTPEEAEDSQSLAIKKVGIYDFYAYDIKRDNRIGYGPRGGVGVFRELGVGALKLEVFFTFTINSLFYIEKVHSGVPDLSLNYGGGVTFSYLFSVGKLEI